jgi:hypothetical protein
VGFGRRERGLRGRAGDGSFVGNGGGCDHECA